MTSRDQDAAEGPRPGAARTDLAALDLRLRLPKDQYRIRRAALERELFELQRAAWKARLATVLVVEGWDGADKAGAVRKLTARLEPRGLEVHDVAEPRSFESQMPWLWRFWKTVPAYGRLAIYERSWFGQAIRERITGRLGEPTWQRRCTDIVDFECTLALDRYLVVKCFLHLSHESQRRRLEQWQEDPDLAWRLDGEVWARHDRYQDALTVVTETLRATDHDLAPWTLVPAEDHRWARVQVMQTLRDAWTWRLGALAREEARP